MSAETAAKSSEMAAPEDPETVVFVSSSGTGEPDRYHEVEPGADRPPCWSGPHDPEWVRRALGSLSVETEPCRRCYGDDGVYRGGSNQSHGEQTCPLCGEEGLSSLASHIGSPPGRGCPVTPVGGGETDS